MSKEQLTSPDESLDVSSQESEAVQAPGKIMMLIRGVVLGFFITGGSFVAQAESEPINENVINPINKVLAKLQGAEYRQSNTDETASVIADRLKAEGYKPIVIASNKH
jgi:hypothetical protein